MRPSRTILERLLLWPAAYSYIFTYPMVEEMPFRIPR